MKPIENLKKIHAEVYSSRDSLRIFACPGRINLIGEHVDYNGGHVLPAAVDKSIFLSVTPNKEKKLRFHSTAFDGIDEISIDDLYNNNPDQDKWWVYAAGAVKYTADKGWPLDHGFDFTYESTIPVGSGMSSSAALTEVTVYALTELLNISMTKPHMAFIGQRIETELAGVSCGIMDQFAVVTGRKNHAVLLNTGNLEYEYVKVESDVVHWVLVNSGVKHSLKDSGYNDRRRDCENAVEKFKEAGIKKDYLCHFTMEEFENNKNILSENEKKRAVHAITEELRTMNFEKIIKDGQYEQAGELLFQSHESLRDNFEVSIPEIDKMIEWSASIDGVLGARMMGGGFGGCTLNMVQKEKVEDFKNEISGLFKKEFGEEPEIYDCIIGDGVREIEL